MFSFVKHVYCSVACLSVEHERDLRQSLQAEDQVKEKWNRRYISKIAAVVLQVHAELHLCRFTNSSIPESHLIVSQPQQISLQQNDRRFSDTRTVDRGLKQKRCASAIDIDVVREVDDVPCP